MSAHSKIAETQPHPSRVIAIPPEEPKVAELHFRSKLAFETDPSDVYMDLQNNSAEIIVIDARTQEAYSQEHVPGANQSSLAQNRLIIHGGYAEGQGPSYLLRWNSLQRIHQGSNAINCLRLPGERNA